MGCGEAYQCAGGVTSRGMSGGPSTVVLARNRRHGTGPPCSPTSTTNHDLVSE